MSSTKVANTCETSSKCSMSNCSTNKIYFALKIGISTVSLDSYYFLQSYQNILLLEGYLLKLTHYINLF